MTKKTVQGLLILLALSFQGGCTTHDKNLFADYPEEMTRFSIVSISAPGFALPRTSTISFHPEMSIHGDSSDPSSSETRALLNELLQQSMLDKGLNFSPYVRARGEFWVAYTVVYESTMSDELMTRKFGMMPGFINSQPTRYEKGSLILDVIDASKQKTVWRSSVQGLAAPELSDELRRIRLRSALDQMLGGLPVADS